jgi:hypothetical protein
VWEPTTTRFYFKVTLRLTASRSVCLSWCRAQSGNFDQRFFSSKVTVLSSGTPSLTRGRVCHLSIFVIAVYSSQYIQILFTFSIYIICVRHSSVMYCGSFPHERQSTNVRCYATAFLFHFHGNQQYVTTLQYCNALTSGSFNWSAHTQQSVAMQRMAQNCLNEISRRKQTLVNCPRLGSIPRHTD